MSKSLILHIQKLVPGFDISPEQLQPYIETRRVAKEEVLLQEGEVCDKIYFVNTGCLYIYYDYEGRREVIHFALENWWLTDYKSFPDAKPAVYAIAAMEDSEISSLSRADYEALLTQFPLMALYFNKIHERAYGAALYKQKSYAVSSKADFYRYFRNTYPDIIKRIPDHLFASYMGVSPEKLEEIKQAYLS